MYLKYLLPAGLLACSFLNIQNVYAQDPITFIDENGEKVSYGEPKEWTRTIHFTFYDDQSRNYEVYQTTAGNEVWITNRNGVTEYHIGNNGECGWPAFNVPQVDGYVQTHLQVPEIDLYWHPEMVYDNEVTVSYARVGEWCPEMEEITPPHTSSSPITPIEATVSEPAEPVSTDSPAETSDVPEETESPTETSAPDDSSGKKDDKSGFNWVIPGAAVCVAGTGAAAYYVVKKLNLAGEDDE